MLDWRTVCPSNDRKHLVKGTELESCIPPGFASRFRIASVRTYDADRNADALYRVYDAETVNDAQVREGILPASVGQYPTLEAALAAIEPYRYVECSEDG